MEFARTPQWDLPPAEAQRRQRELAGQVVLEDGFRGFSLVAGVDVSVPREGEIGRAAVVVWRPSDGAVVEQLTAEARVSFPYVPGLLAFREGPPIEAALRRLRHEPDLLIVDGQGIAHPRRLGIAAHLGVLLDRPTIGSAKSRLYGLDADPGSEPGDSVPLLAPDGSRLGSILRTRAGTNPLYVSPGHRVSFETAESVILACCRGYRLPEPQRLADKLSKARPEAADTEPRLDL
jgi:deoxyribonuclease V